MILFAQSNVAAEPADRISTDTRIGKLVFALISRRVRRAEPRGVVVAPCRVGNGVPFDTRSARVACVQDTIDNLRVYQVA